MLAAVKNNAAINELTAINNGYKNINNINPEQQIIRQLFL